METYERLVVGPFPFRSLPPLGVDDSMVDDVWGFSDFSFAGEVDAESLPLTAARLVMSREQELAGDG